MTDTEHMTIDAHMADVLDRVRRRYGIATREDAAEWLVKRRLARSARQIAQRGRALHIARSGSESPNE